MNDPQNVNKTNKTSENSKDSGSLADSSVNAPDAPGADPAGRGEGHRRIPGNDQADGLKKAESEGKNPAKP